MKKPVIGGSPPNPLFIPPFNGFGTASSNVGSLTGGNGLVSRGMSGSGSHDEGRSTELLAKDRLRVGADIGVEVSTSAAVEDCSNVYYAAVQMSRMSMVLADPNLPDYPLVFCNRAFCELTGYSEAEALGRNCRFLQGKLTDPESTRVLREAIAARADAKMEMWNYRKDGTAFWNTMFVGPVFDPNGKLLYFFGSQMDTTARREAEEAKAQAQRLDTLGAIAAGIAHEFNNLMTVVVGSIERVMASPLSERQAERLQRASCAARSAGHLTQQMLSFVRNSQRDRGMVDVNEVLRDFDRVLTQVAGANRFVDFDLAPGSLFAKLNVSQFELALINLVRNAADASDEDGWIMVSTRELTRGSATGLPGNAAAVEIAVADAGTGIPTDVAGRVMRPFFTTKTPSRGTGLGLSMVQGFVQQYAGRLFIEPNDGQGTKVRLVFARPE